MDDLTFETVTDRLNKTLYQASFKLTQEETKRFSAKPKNMVDIQVRALTIGGDAMASDKKSISVQDVLNDEVLV